TKPGACARSPLAPHRTCDPLLHGMSKASPRILIGTRKGQAGQPVYAGLFENPWRRLLQDKGRKSESQCAEPKIYCLGKSTLIMRLNETNRAFRRVIARTLVRCLENLTKIETSYQN